MINTIITDTTNNITFWKFYFDILSTSSGEERNSEMSSKCFTNANVVKISV